MRYRIESYIAMKLHNALEELEEVRDGFGVVECEDLDYSNGFLVWNTEKKMVEHKYFNPSLFEKWNGDKIAIDYDKKAEVEYYELEKSKDRRFKIEARERVELLEIENQLSQEVLNFLLFKTDLDLIMTTFQNSRSKENDNMLPAYLALQISKKAKKSKEEAEEFYQMSVERFPQFRNDIDNLLI